MQGDLLKKDTVKRWSRKTARFSFFWNRNPRLNTLILAPPFLDSLEINLSTALASYCRGFWLLVPIPYVSPVPVCLVRGHFMSSLSSPKPPNRVTNFLCQRLSISSSEKRLHSIQVFGFQGVQWHKNIDEDWLLNIRQNDRYSNPWQNNDRSQITT